MGGKKTQLVLMFLGCLRPAVSQSLAPRVSLAGLCGTVSWLLLGALVSVGWDRFGATHEQAEGFSQGMKQLEASR